MIRFVVDEILKEKNMTQTELAKRAEIRPATLSSICRNTCKTVDKDVLDRICIELNCGIEHIVILQTDD